MTTDTLRDRGAANAPEIDQAAELEQRREALKRDRARFAELEPQGRQLLGMFTRGNLVDAMQAFERALSKGSGMVLEATINTYQGRAHIFQDFGLQAVAAPVPRLHRQEELDTAAAALRTAQAELATFEAQAYTLEDIPARVVQAIRLRETIRQLETLITRLRAAAQ